MKYLKVATSTYSLHTSQPNSGSKDFSQHRLRLARVKVIFQCRLQVKKIYFRLEIFTTKEDGLWSIFLVSSANICSYKVSAFFIKDLCIGRFSPLLRIPWSLAFGALSAFEFQSLD